jgi:predicted RNase H-like HicB family nuclease
MSDPAPEDEAIRRQQILEQANTAFEMAEDAISLWIETTGEDGVPIPGRRLPG